MSPKPGSESAMLAPLAGRSGRWYSLRLEYDSSRTRSPWWTPILSVVLALLLCAVFIAANGMSPLVVYEKMFREPSAPPTASLKPWSRLFRCCSAG